MIIKTIVDIDEKIYQLQKNNYLSGHEIDALIDYYYALREKLKGGSQ